MTTVPFDRLGLEDALLRALADEGYLIPTEIQVAAIPEALAGRDVLGIAQTGTGKTAAFSLPILQRLLQRPGRGGMRPLRALILAPTRELAVQVAESLSTYGRHLELRTAVVLGGVGKAPQVTALRRGVDILVATPGRLLDLMGEGHVRLDRVEVLVLDEADRMLDMGFIHDVKRIVSQVPRQRQTMFFSATMPDEVTELAHSMLQDPFRVEVTPLAPVATRIEQRVLFVDRGDKQALLEHLLADRAVRRVLVFARTKHRANRVAKQLVSQRLSADAIHSNKSQGARQRALDAFTSGKVRILAATDIVARGIDVDGITHVINFDLPDEPESYVHRIGRTARAGAVGVALSFCDADELIKLVGIERAMGQDLEEDPTHPFHAAHLAQKRLSRRPTGGRQAAAPAARSAAGSRAARSGGAGQGARARPAPAHARRRPRRGADSGGSEGREGSAYGRSRPGKSEPGKAGSGKAGPGKAGISGRPAAGRPGSSRPSSGRPASSRPASGRPASGRPASGKAHGGDRSGPGGGSSPSAAGGRRRSRRRRPRP